MWALLSPTVSTQNHSKFALVPSVQNRVKIRELCMEDRTLGIEIKFFFLRSSVTPWPKILGANWFEEGAKQL